RSERSMPARGIIAAMSLDSVSSQQSTPAYRPTATVQAIGSRWGVAAGHALAAEAAAHVLGAGGNAIDAGVAAGICLGVVHCDMGGRLGQGELAGTPASVARAEAREGGSGAAGVRAARDELYRGETAARLAEFHRAEKGPLTAEDLASFEVEVERAIVGTYGPWQVGVCGFWCQGPVLLQMLNLIEGTDVAALGHNSPAYLHLLAETARVAFADRDACYGDPHFVDVPAERLLSRAHAAERRALIRDRAWREMPPVGERRGAAAIAGGSGESLDTS